MPLQIGRPHTAQLTRLEFREIDVRRDGQHHFLQACMLYFKACPSIPQTEQGPTRHTMKAVSASGDNMVD
jgi:hypothetical protein